VKPVNVQRLAEQDIFEAIDYYAKQAPNVVDRFMKAVDRAMASIGESPRTGSPGFAEVLEIPGLRYRTIASFPYAAFYQESDHDISVLRVLHHGRDIMTLIGAADADESF
jgi:toxin ParE1/3/4